MLIDFGPSHGQHIGTHEPFRPFWARKRYDNDNDNDNLYQPLKKEVKRCPSRGSILGSTKK